MREHHCSAPGIVATIGRESVSVAASRPGFAARVKLLGILEFAGDLNKRQQLAQTEAHCLYKATDEYRSPRDKFRVNWQRLALYFARDHGSPFYGPLVLVVVRRT